MALFVIDYYPEQLMLGLMRQGAYYETPQNNKNYLNLLQENVKSLLYAYVQYHNSLHVSSYMCT